MSIINQLFVKKPSLELVLTIVNLLGINSLDDKKVFTINDLEEFNTVEKFNNIIPQLREYYLKCKQKIFLENINSKKCITIARQFLKLYNYDILGVEKSINNKKVLFYCISTNKEKQNIKKTKKPIKREFIVVFD